MIRKLISCLACCTLLLGCSSVVHLPTDYALPTNDGNAIHSPIGRFSVHGTSTDPNHKAPNLCEYFFHDFLRGFDIDNIEIVATKDSNQVLVQPYVGAIPVTETMLLKARTAKDGTVSWGMETPTGEALATQILGPVFSLLTSQGTGVFLYGNESTELLTDDARALIIAYEWKMVGLSILSPRVSDSEKRWYRYPAFTPGIVADGPVIPTPVKTSYYFPAVEPAGGMFVGRGGLFYDKNKYRESVEQIRADEGILFEGIVVPFGRIGFPVAGYETGVVATPTALVFESGARVPYSYVTSIRIGDFENSAAPLPAWKDTLIINESAGFLLISEGKKTRQNFGNASFPERRALAESLMSVVETYRSSVDVFGKTLPPRPVDLAIVVDKADIHWNYSPKYLNARFKDERKAFDELFDSAREEISKTFRAEVVELLEIRDVPEGTYSFDFAGGFSFGKWLHRMDYYLGPDEFEDVDQTQLKLRHEDLIVLGPIQLSFSEILDPQGTPSVRVNMRFPSNFYDSSRRLHTSPTHHNGTAISLPLMEWLEGGQARIIAEVKKGLKKTVEKAQDDLSSRIPTEE